MYAHVQVCRCAGVEMSIDACIVYVDMYVHVQAYVCAHVCAY